MTKKIMLYSTLLVLILAGGTSLVAQEGRGNGRLVGVVLDSNENPIADATVTLEYLQYDRTLTTTTSNKGAWRFISLGLGVVKVTAEKEGFVKSTIQLNVSGANRNPKQKIVLRTMNETDPNLEKNIESKNEFMQANALFKQDKFKEALELYRQFAEKQPQLYKIGINIANCYLRLGRYDEAITLYQSVLDKIMTEDPKKQDKKEIALLYTSIGECYMQQDQLEKAEDYFKKSIEMDQSDHAITYNVAEILFVAGKTDEAIRYYLLTIQIKPDWARAYKQLGYAYLNKGDMAKAVDNLKKFLELAPDSPEADGIKELITSLK